ncbi:MAG: hypothetical protein IT384_08270 [Deltaproteobacteria bacterium]|nr:hypothetical protein [Deltaproteobacteria bacterium]
MLSRVVSLSLTLAACADPPASAPRSEATHLVGPPGIELGAVPLDRYCEARAQVECHRLESCGPQRLISLYGSGSACAGVRAEICERSFMELTTRVTVDLGLVRIDPLLIGAALSDYSRRSCASLLAPPSPLVGAMGLLQLGDRCRADPLCASGFCDRSLGSCGQCAEAPIGAPRSCPLSCPIGETCRCQTLDGGVRDCECARALAEGGDCAQDRSSCDEGLVCLDFRDSTGQRFTRCVPVPGGGERCGVETGLTQCLGDAYCGSDGTGGGTCLRPNVVGRGESCDDVARLCPVDHDCRGVCAPRARDGEPCLPPNPPTIPDGGPPTCHEGVCFGTCQGTQPRNGVCFTGLDCQPGLGCYGQGFGGSGSCLNDEDVRQITQQGLACP